MASISRGKIEKLYENLVQCYRKVNQLHEDIEVDHAREEICEKYPNYKRQLPLNLLEKAADCLDGRVSKIVYIGTDDYSKALIINGFLSRPSLIPTERSAYRLPLQILPVNFGKEERLEVVYRDIREIVGHTLNTESLQSFLAPFKSQIEENPAFLQKILSDYVSAVGSKPAVGANTATGEILGDSVDTTKDEALVIATSFLQSASKLGNKYREDMARKDELISGTSSSAIYAKEAYFYADNVFLKENRLTFTDLPSSWLQDEYLEESSGILNSANCVVVLLDVNQLAISDQLDAFWKKLTIEGLPEKTFFIIDGFEKLLREDLSANFIAGLLEKLKAKFSLAKFDMNRVIFSSSFRVALGGLMNQPNKTREDETRFEELVRSFHEKRQSLNPQLEVAKLDKLKAVYGDGGISQIRNNLLDFVSVELILGRCYFAKENLFQVSEMINFLLGPEKIKVKEFAGGSSDPIQRILEPITSAYMKVKSEFEVGFLDLDKVLSKLSVKLKNKILKAFKSVEVQKWDELIAQRELKDINEIMLAILEQCKADFANDFVQITSSEVKTLIKARFLGSLERGLLQKKVKTMDEQLETEYANDYDVFEQAFLSKINWAMESKPIEMTWSLKKIVIKPKVEAEWSAEVALQFKEELSTFFVNRYSKLVDDLLDCVTEYLSIYYEQYKANVDKLIDKIQSDILKNMDGKKEDKSQIYKKVRRHIKLLGYVKNASEIDKIKQEVSVILN